MNPGDSMRFNFFKPFWNESCIEKAGSQIKYNVFKLTFSHFNDTKLISVSTTGKIKKITPIVPFIIGPTQ